MRKLLIAIAACFVWASAHAQSQIGAANGPGPPVFPSQTSISANGSYAYTLRRLSRSAAIAVADNPYDNPAMSAPAWVGSATYSQADRVSVSTNIYEQQFGQKCVAAATGGPTGTGYNIVDGTCIWKYLPGVVVANADMPTVTIATQWAINTVFNPGATSVVYSGSGATAVGNFYTLTSVAQCTTASSGSGPSGTGTGITDGTCVWSYSRTEATAIFSAASVNSIVWNAGAGNLLSHVNVYGGTIINSVSTGYMAVAGATVNGQPSAVASRIEYITDAPKLIIRDFEVSNSNTLPSAWRLIICRVDGSACHYVSPTPYSQIALAPVGGWGRHIIDFNGVSEPRDIIIEIDNANSFGGIDIPLINDLYKPSGPTVLSMAVGGDSYPAGGGMRWGPYPAFPGIVADRLGIRNIINSSIGGCGYIVSCSSGTQASRINDLITANNGACADIYMDANGTNDIAGSTPAAIVAAMLDIHDRIRAACGNVPIFKIGMWAHANGVYAAGIAVENLMSSTIAGLNDSNYFWIPVLTDPNGAWQTGTGYLGAAVGLASFATNVMTVTAMTSGTWQLGMKVTSATVNAATVITGGSGLTNGQTGAYSLSTSPGTIIAQTASGNAQNGTGNTDITLEGQGNPQNAHPNILGNRFFASRMVSIIRLFLSKGNY